MTVAALSIAGLDPSGGAGVLQDVRTFAACGVYGMAAVTSVTAQDTVAVRSWEPVDPATVGAQIEAVARDIPPGATKTGMTGTAAVVAEIARVAGETSLGPLVVDPVLRASSGASLGDDGLLRALRERLVPIASVVTPNLSEAAALTGNTVESLAQMERAARDIVSLGARAALVTGGHAGTDEAVDVLLTEGRVHLLRAPRIATRDDHGTGCVLSAAICARLASGASIEDAARYAKGVVTRALENAARLGNGRGPVVPAPVARPWPLAGHPFE